MYHFVCIIYEARHIGCIVICSNKWKINIFNLNGIKCVDPISQWHILYLRGVAGCRCCCSYDRNSTRHFKNIHRRIWFGLCTTLSERSGCTHTRRDTVRRCIVLSVSIAGRWWCESENNTLKKRRTKKKKKKYEKSGDIRCTHCLFTCRVADNVGVQTAKGTNGIPWEATTTTKMPFSYFFFFFWINFPLSHFHWFACADGGGGGRGNGVLNFYFLMMCATSITNRFCKMPTKWKKRRQKSQILNWFVFISFYGIHIIIEIVLQRTITSGIICLLCAYFISFRNSFFFFCRFMLS